MKANGLRLPLCFFTLVLTLGFHTPSFAQVVTGALVGTIRDSTGAVVPNSTVTVKNQETGVSLELKTNGAGEYVAPYLKPGVYSVAARAEGFHTVLSDNNQVHVNEKIR